MRVRVTPRHGQAEEGEQLYLHTYPKARGGTTLDGQGGDLNPDLEVKARAFVRSWTREVQRVVLRTDAGRVWHFTVPKKVEAL